MPTLYVVAGPNGCGKSTLTRTAWLSGLEIIDPDAIARRMPDSPGQAVREALRRRRAALRAGRTHLVETTLAGSGVFRYMAAARTVGYRIELHYMSVDSPDLALNRIRNRKVRAVPDHPIETVARTTLKPRYGLPATLSRRRGTILGVPLPARVASGSETARAWRGMQGGTLGRTGFLPDS